jgi:hypothetical protein
LFRKEKACTRIPFRAAGTGCSTVEADKWQGDWQSAALLRLSD